MFTSDITLGTATYSLVSQTPYRSIRSDSTEPVAEPNTMTIASETNKKGMRSCVVYLEDLKIVSSESDSEVRTSPVRFQAKLQFEPFKGRTDHLAAILAERDQVVAFLNDDSNIIKLMNQET